jgi:hypothetical protein
LQAVLSFLAEMFVDGYSYTSVNCARSALSAVLDKIEGHKVGDHPLVCRLLKGVSKLRPPKPRYQCTWDVGKVLDLFSSWPPDSELTLKQLTIKLCALLALVTAQRVQTLVSINVSNILLGDPVQILIPSILKTTSVSNSNRPIVLVPFHQIRNYVLFLP